MVEGSAVHSAGEFGEIMYPLFNNFNWKFSTYLIGKFTCRLSPEMRKFALFSGLASTYPEPASKRAFIEAFMYNDNYDSILPSTYSWPTQHEVNAPLKAGPTKFDRNEEQKDKDKD